MAKRFKKGDELYLMVKVHDTEPAKGYDYTIEWKDAVDGMACLASVGQVQLVSNADFGTSNGTYWQRKYDECSEEANRRITELEALLKEVTATRDEAIRQNNELVAENEHQKSACEEQKRLAQNWKENAYKLDKEKEKLMASNAELKEWYDEANKTASEAAEANDELKAKIAQLKAENEIAKQERKDAEATYNVVADTSLKRKNRITTMEEVIVALVEKIRRLESDD